MLAYSPTVPKLDPAKLFRGRSRIIEAMSIPFFSEGGIPLIFSLVGCPTSKSQLHGTLITTHET